MSSIIPHYLYPSAIYTSKESSIVTTILGSCVSVCLWDTKLEFGGINHYMLPLWNGQGLASPKYGNFAIPKLIDKMVFMGSDPGNLIAKVIGGGEVLVTNNDTFHIGDRNIQIAFEILEERKITIAGKSVGGSHGRKIQFRTDTGMIKQVFIKKSL
jgi:chemotaxis protein CheD